MKIKVTKDTVAAKKRVRAGQVVDLYKGEALFLISLGKAEPFIEVDDRPRCKTCGKPFDRRAPRQVYCSPGCR